MDRRRDSGVVRLQRRGCHAHCSRASNDEANVANSGTSCIGQRGRRQQTRARIGCSRFGSLAHSTMPSGKGARAHVLLCQAAAPFHFQPPWVYYNLFLVQESRVDVLARITTQSLPLSILMFTPANIKVTAPMSIKIANSRK